jgi:hypothetical protein
MGDMMGCRLAPSVENRCLAAVFLVGRVEVEVKIRQSFICAIFTPLFPTGDAEEACCLKDRKARP